MKSQYYINTCTHGSKTKGLWTYTIEKRTPGTAPGGFCLVEMLMKDDTFREHITFSDSLNLRIFRRKNEAEQWLRNNGQST